MTSALRNFSAERKTFSIIDNKAQILINHAKGKTKFPFSPPFTENDIIILFPQKEKIKIYTAKVYVKCITEVCVCQAVK